MIQIIYHPTENRLTVQGHAHSSAYGRDLICAAVSALVLTLSANIGAMEQQGYVSEAVVILESGNARLRCKPNPPYRRRVEQTFESICLGFRLLARKFPGFVTYRETER